jgi:hypothetical protein
MALQKPPEKPQLSADEQIRQDVVGNNLTRPTKVVCVEDLKKFSIRYRKLF